MAFSYIASANGVGTTSSIDTTGATLLVIVAAYDSGATISDSKGNTWTALTAQNQQGGSSTFSRIYYCVSPTVGSGHTATVSIGYGAVALLAYSGVDTASPLDGESGDDGPASPPVTGWGAPSFTPGSNGCLLILGACFGNDGGGSLAADSGFTVRQARQAVNLTSYGVGVADLIQTTAAAVAPNFTWASGSTVSTVLAAFKAGSSSAATSTTLNGPTSGIAGVPSTNFTVGANGTITGTVTVTPSDSSGGGTFSPTSVNISSGTPTATFTYTPASAGAKTISTSNNGGLSNPSSITYTASAAPALSAATIASNGQDIALTLTASATVTLADMTIRVGGVIVYPTAITGSGTSWTLTMGLRWLLAGQTVTAQYQSGTPVTATNSSIIATRSTRHVSRQFGLFLHIGLETWTDEEWSDGAAASSVWSPSNSAEAMVDQWIACAQLAGMKYLVLTAKHHSGFCLWPSASTTYDIAATTWYSSNGSPDLLGIFCQRVRSAGLGVGIYFSPWDRKFERDNPSFTGAAYQAHTQAQLTELLTNYGPVDVLWLDGWNWLAGGGVSIATLPYASVFTFARNLQPQCAVIVNNHRTTLFGTGSDNASDLIEYEGGTVGDQTPSGNKLPAEECDTIRGDNAWFWKTAADTPLTVSDVNTAVARINGRNGAFLLNCPPNRSGLIEDGLVRILAGVGAARAESVGGIMAWHGTGAARSFSVTLTTDGTTPAASLTGLKWAFYDVPNPGRHERPTSQGIGSTNGSGVLAGTVFTSLGSGGIGWLVVTDSDGTIPAGTGASGFSGPVTVT